MWKRLLTGVASLSVLISGMGYAASYVTVSPGSMVFPSAIYQASSSAGDFTITNTYGADLKKLYIINDTPHLKLYPALDSDYTNCSTGKAFDLAANASCSLRIIYSANSQQDIATPPSVEICKTPQLSQYCSKLVLPVTTVKSERASAGNTLQWVSYDKKIAPGEKALFSVKNSGAETADFVHLILPSYLLTHIRSGAKLDCKTLAPGATCDMHVTFTKDMPRVRAAIRTSAQGNNTRAAEGAVHVVPSLIDVGNVFFTQPGDITTVIKNNSHEDISNLQIENPANESRLTGVTDVTPGSGCQNGQSLSVGQSCEKVYRAASGASGLALLKVSFVTADTIAKTIKLPVVVAAPTIAVNPNAQGKTSPLKVHGDRGVFKVVNTGHFP
jgi:hypothetical protein